MIVLTLLLIAAASATADERPWPDPVANDVIPYQSSLLSHGPMLGQPAATSIRIWVRTAEPTEFRVVYSTELPLRADTHGVEGRTIAERDNTGIVDLTDLQPNTRYYYAIVIDGQLPDIRMDFGDPWPSFKTLPDDNTYRDANFNPAGKFNITFGFGACASQQPKASGGHWGSAASFRNLYRQHGDEVQFFVINGDYIYEELRDGKIGGYRANYRRYMERGRSMQNLQRRVPWLFTFDDHEVGGDVRAKVSGKSMLPWFEYAGWADFNDSHPYSLLLTGEERDAYYWDWKLGNCHFFFLDCRGERTRFDYAKRKDPEQSILGAAQRKWLMDSAANSDAQFIFIMSVVPWFLPHTGAHVGRGLQPKGDTFVGYQHERKLLTDFFDQLDKPVLLLTGDVHNAASIQVTDNVWEMLCGPLNSTGHPLGTAGDPPRGGIYDSDGRDVKVKWIAGFPNNVHYSRIRNTVYGIMQVNNITRAGTPEGTGYQYSAFEHPQVVVRFHDGHTGRLLYAEGISTLDAK